MTDQEKDRLIVEELGECWHEWAEYHDDDRLENYQCKKCKEIVLAIHIFDLHNGLVLDTPSGFFWWFPKMLKRFPDFVSTYNGSHDVDLGLLLQVKIINPVIGRDCFYEYLRGKV